MTLAKWDESIRIAKVKMGLDPKSYIMIKGKLLKEAQAIYQMLILNEKL
jgi:uncharacterized Fe-S cluster-containing MiaB family protein|tara:strand:+ start:1358 stop:1504 length:147 start_codon:yes stop_codon:yes gene_type:complete